MTLALLASIGVLAAIAAFELRLLLRYRGKIARLEQERDLLESANEELERHAKIYARPMDADTADDIADRLAGDQRLRRKD